LEKSYLARSIFRNQKQDFTANLPTEPTEWLALTLSGSSRVDEVKSVAVFTKDCILLVNDR